MPHQCTNCGRTFDDGSKQMLSGCPDCGGNKFQFQPRGTTDEPSATGPDAAPDATASGSPGPADGATDTSSEAGPTAQSTLESYPSSTGGATATGSASSTAEGDADIIEAPAEPIEAGPDVEDRAQASARRSVVSEDELPPASGPSGHEAPDAPSEEPERPDLAQLRKELNEQFESIKILQPGEYELNLMELYDRDEYIIALEEDGRYVIDVPDTWDEAE